MALSLRYIPAHKALSHVAARLASFLLGQLLLTLLNVWVRVVAVLACVMCLLLFHPLASLGRSCNFRLLALDCAQADTPWAFSAVTHSR